MQDDESSTIRLDPGLFSFRFIRYIFHNKIFSLVGRSERSEVRHACQNHQINGMNHAEYHTRILLLAFPG